MKIKYLGTAAAEGIPGIFCTCDTCERARKAGGKNIQTRSQAIIDDSLLIDLPPDTYMHILHGELNLNNVEHCLITHPHQDHFYPDELSMREPGFCVVDKPLTLYSGETAHNIICDYIKRRNLQSNTFSVKVIPYQSFCAGEYKITPIPATHDEKIHSLIYIIEKDGKAILYAHDTGILTDEAWCFIAKSGIKFDYVSIDCTGVFLKGWINGHLSLDTCEVFKNKLIECGAVKDSTIYCISHFSHNSLAIRDEIVPCAEKLGFAVAYDGFDAEV